MHTKADHPDVDASTRQTSAAHLTVTRKKTAGGSDTPPAVPEPPTKGGKGGEEGAPPLPPSNGDFVRELMGGVADGAVAAVCSKPGDPGSGGWFAQAVGDVDRQCPPDANNYINCSSFVPTEDGQVAATKESFSALHFVVLDDVGAKVELSRLEGVTPTWQIETSPGNYQFGFKLAEPLRDIREAEQLQKAAIKDSGLSDRGANGVARWVRLPSAINGKQTHRDADGQPFRVRTAVWNPDRTYTVDQLVDALGLELRPAKQGASVPTSEPQGGPVIPSGVFSPAPTENPVLAALKARGLHKREIAPGKHDVTCPWVAEHTDEVDGGTAYFEPTTEYPQGGFKCQHSHGDGLHIAKLLKHLDVDTDLARGRPRIRLIAGEMNAIRRAAELALARRGGFFQMGGAIVTVRIDPGTGDATVERLSEAALTSELSEAVDWYRYDKQSKSWLRTDPPPRNVMALMKAPRFEALPPLKSIARQPFLRDDGTLVTVAGYDAASARFGVFSEAKFGLPEPTEAAARDALSKLNGLLDEFAFASSEDRSAALCAMITAAIRPGLQFAPAFSITASAPGSGKSYLASVIVPFAGPGAAAKISYPTTDEEASKAVLSVLASNPAVLLFDDMQRDWRPFGAINRMLTSDTITERLLGTSSTLTVSTRSLVLGTGNNIDAIRDMARRVVSIRLHHRVESPALKAYSGRPAAEVAAKREEYVAAALTIVRAWQAAGSPKAELQSIASFEKWGDLCRQPLVWLGLPDPAASLIEQISHDPDRELLGRLLRAWHEEFGDEAIELRRLVQEAGDGTDLDDALHELPVIDRDVVNRSKLGWYLKHNKGRVVDGLELQRVDSKHRTAWRVVPVAP